MPGIVVGVDGSGCSRRALDWAINEAAIRHTPLTVLTVYPPVRGHWSAVVEYPWDADPAHPRKTVQEEADAALKRLTAQARPPEFTATSGLLSLGDLMGLPVGGSCRAALSSARTGDPSAAAESGPHRPAGSVR